MRLVHYIHFNPQKHGFVSDFREYPYSSYQTMLSEKPTQIKRYQIKRYQVLDWFDGKATFIAKYQELADETEIRALIGGDDD